MSVDHAALAAGQLHPPGSHAHLLADATDVDVTGLEDGQGFVWNAGLGLFVPGAAGPSPQEHYWSTAGPAVPHAINDEFDGTVIDAKWTRVRSPTPKASWLVADGKLNYVHDLATAGDELDVWMQPDTIAIGDYIEVGFRYHPYQQWDGPCIGFSSSGTWGSGVQVGTFMHWSGGAMRWMFNTWNGFTGRTQDGAILDRAYYNLVGYVRVRYIAANTFGIYSSMNGVQYMTIQTNYGRTLTPTHWMVGMHFLGGAVGGSGELFYVRKNPVAL